jgi:hypothetical protein
VLCRKSQICGNLKIVVSETARFARETMASVSSTNGMDVTSKSMHTGIFVEDRCTGASIRDGLCYSPRSKRSSPF